MKSTVVGQLKRDKDVEDWFNSKPVEIPYFGNVKLRITFTDAEEESYMEDADAALSSFLKLTAKNRISDTEMVHAYYTEVINETDADPLELDAPEEIWDYVTPIEITIDEDDQGDICVNVSCECEWDEDDGLQLVFKKGKALTRAGAHE